MSEPPYQPFDAAEIPCYQDQAKKVKLNVIAGSYSGFKGPVKHPSEIEAFTIYIEEGGVLTLTSKSDWNAILYQLGGHSEVSNGTMEGRQLAHFNYDGVDIKLHAKRDSRFLFVSAPSINEPLAQYGPFVMNRPEELQQAISDYQSGKMGRL